MRVYTLIECELTDDPNEYVVLQSEWLDYDGHVAKCDRSAQAEAGQAAQTSKTTASGYGTTAAGIGNNIIPTLERDVNNAPGFSATDLNNMLVAGEQGAGGAASGITGQAGLTAERTRNSSALSSVLDEAARRKAQASSQNALQVQNANAQLKQQQRAQGLSGLEGLYGTDVGAQLKAMGIEDQDINTQIQAGQTGWLQNTEGALSTLSNMGLGAAKAAGV